MKLHNVLYGTAYYPEYMPYERTQIDMKMMKNAGINTIRIAESTWSTWEPQDSVFQFALLHQTIQAARDFDINVIVGTPTYAVPTWLVRKFPDVLGTTHNGPCHYGHRQNMDITNPHYLFYAERIIRKMLVQVKEYPNVIGFQLDNETKAYDTCSSSAQSRFVAYLKSKFASIEEMNQAYGLSYWSNDVHTWEDFPDIRGTINGSLGAEYERFQRQLVTEFLAWQSSIVREYAREDQFITQNFDYDWRDYSYGMQPEVNQFEAVKSLTIPGFDLYHPSQNLLTGAEISFGGAIGRAVAGVDSPSGQGNYLILETEAQGNRNWLPYSGQLRLQAYSHLANGADSVMYWHWHSIHNAIESYWKGILSHDLKENETYREVQRVGTELKQLSANLLHLRKENKVAIMLDNHSLSGMKWFSIRENLQYNDVARWFADALYEMNVEYDVIPSTQKDFSSYNVVITPALYSASGAVRENLLNFVKNGGHLVASFKSFFSDENLKIACEEQPAKMTECFGMVYDQFTNPVDVSIKVDAQTFSALEWMELLRPITAKTWVPYKSIPYQGYAAVTHNEYGHGTATYVGCFFEKNVLQKLLKKVLNIAGVEVPKFGFPLIIRRGVNEGGQKVCYYLNYSMNTVSVLYDGESGTLLVYNDKMERKTIANGSKLELGAWNLAIVVSE